MKRHLLVATVMDFNELKNVPFFTHRRNIGLRVRSNRMLINVVDTLLRCQICFIAFLAKAAALSHMNVVRLCISASFLLKKFPEIFYFL